MTSICETVKAVTCCSGSLIFLSCGQSVSQSVPVISLCLSDVLCHHRYGSTLDQAMTLIRQWLLFRTEPVPKPMLNYFQLNLRNKLGEIGIEIPIFFFKKMHFNKSPANHRPFFPGLNVLLWSVRSITSTMNFKRGRTWKNGRYEPYSNSNTLIAYDITDLTHCGLVMPYADIYLG